MEAEIKTAITKLTDKAANAPTAHEAMQYTQAALNLAHVAQIADLDIKK